MADKDMENKSCDCECCDMPDKKWWKHHGKGWHKGGGGSGGALYFFGIFGALFYFLQNTQGFIPIVLGVLKALVWPAFVVFKALELLKV